MLGKFSLDRLVTYGGKPAGLFLMIYLLTMIILIMNFFVAILNDFLSAVANSEQMQSRDFEVMDNIRRSWNSHRSGSCCAWISD